MGEPVFVVDSNPTVEHIAKIEGHASLSLVLDKGTVQAARLKVFEGARYFEAMVRGTDAIVRQWRDGQTVDAPRPASPAAAVEGAAEIVGAAACTLGHAHVERGQQRAQVGCSARVRTRPPCLRAHVSVNSASIDRR
jgi:hypothetical protein